MTFTVLQVPRLSLSAIRSGIVVPDSSSINVAQASPLSQASQKYALQQTPQQKFSVSSPPHTPSQGYADSGLQYTMPGTGQSANVNQSAQRLSSTQGNTAQSDHGLEGFALAARSTGIVAVKRRR